IYNNYHYDIPKDLDPQKIKVKAEKARQLVEGLLTVYKTHEVSEPKLIVYQYHRVENHPPKSARGTDHRERFLGAVASHIDERERAGVRPQEGQYFLAWETIVGTEQPSNSWRILVDAITGHIVNVIDLFQYATGSAQVFDP